MKKFVLIATLLLLSGHACRAQIFHENWYTKLSVDSFFNTEAAQSAIEVENPDIALLNAAIFFATNEARQKRSLPLLLHDQSLEKAAEFHSEEMVEKRFFSHVNKTDKDNRTFDLRIRNKGGEFTAAGENILEMPPFKTGPKGEYDVSKNPDGSFSFLQLNNGKPLKVLSYGDFARTAVKLWMKSPDHKANIMSKSFSHLGCGVAIEDNPFSFKSLPMVLVTQNFGARQ